MDRNGWEWIGMDRNGWEWIGMDGNGWECPNSFFPLEFLSKKHDSPIKIPVNMLIAHT